MASNSEDLLVWMQALFGGKIVSSENFKNMRRFRDTRGNERDSEMTGYGLGIAREEIDGIVMEGHPGAGIGGECHSYYLPEYDAFIVVLFNWSKDSNPAGKAILRKIIHEIIAPDTGCEHPLMHEVY